MPIFYIKQGLRAGEEIELKMPRIIIGRSPDNAIVLLDESVDLAHISLEDRGDRWVLQDLGTPTGTWLNDEVVIGPQRINDGDVITLGTIPLQIQNIDKPAKLHHTLTSLAAEPTSEGASLDKRKGSWFGLIAVALLIFLGTIFVFRSGIFLGVSSGQVNQPPELNLLQAEDEYSVVSGEKIVFKSEVTDFEDLDRVEFWVDDTLEQVKRPVSKNSIKMRLIHSWSTYQPGDYVLSVIAYDVVGQPSRMIKVKVQVRAR